MYKVVINNDYGGFSLSEKCSRHLNEKYGFDIDVEYGYISDEVARHDVRLIEAIEFFGVNNAGGRFASLEIKEINSNIYKIDQYDGAEWIETPDSIEWVVID